MTFIALFALVCVAAVHAGERIPILGESHTMDQSGQYSYTFVSGNGIVARSRGVLVPNENGTGNVLVIDGETSYTSPEGKQITLKYTADKTGFHPSGEHLPKV